MKVIIVFGLACTCVVVSFITLIFNRQIRELKMWMSLWPM